MRFVIVVVIMPSDGGSINKHAPSLILAKWCPALTLSHAFIISFPCYHNNIKSDRRFHSPFDSSKRVVVEKPSIVSFVVPIAAAATGMTILLFQYKVSQSFGLCIQLVRVLIIQQKLLEERIKKLEEEQKS